MSQPITQSTLIPIGLAITFLGGALGAVFWASSVASDARYTRERGNALEVRVERIEIRQQAADTQLATLSVQLTNIQNRLEELKKLLTERVKIN